MGQRSQNLHPTALVHEAFMRLIGRDAEDYESQTHFQAVATKAMRHVLIDYVRGRNHEKRGGDWQRVTLSGVPSNDETGEIDFEALEAALQKLSEVDARGARVVELRFFAGLTESEIGELLGVSERTVRSDWKMAGAWLRSRL